MVQQRGGREVGREEKWTAHKFDRQWDQVSGWGRGDSEPTQPPEGLHCVKLERWPQVEPGWAQWGTQEWSTPGSAGQKLG